MLFDDETGQMVGHATWRRVEDPEPGEGAWGNSHSGQPDTRTQEQRDADAEFARRLAELMVALAIQGAIAAAPHVKRFWGTTLVPALKVLRERLSSIRLPRFTLDSTRAKRALELEAASEVVSSQLAVVEIEPALAMTKAEWDERMTAMLAAEAFRDEQFNVLRRATVSDPKLIVIGDDPDERLTPRDFAAQVQRALGANPAALDESLYAALVDAVREGEQASEPAKRIGRAEGKSTTVGCSFLAVGRARQPRCRLEGMRGDHAALLPSNRGECAGAWKRRRQTSQWTLPMPVSALSHVRRVPRRSGRGFAATATRLGRRKRAD